MNISTALALVAVGLVLPQTCFAHKPDEKTALLKVDKVWSAVASKGKDVNATAAFWTDDATLYPGDGTVLHGKEALRNFVKQAFASPGFHISWKPEKVMVSADGTLGYTAGATLTTERGENGKLTTTKGRYVSIWKHIPGGTWRCVEDIDLTGTR